MKKIAALCILLCLLALCGCGKTESVATEPTQAQTAAPTVPNTTTTLMIYMIGSDLEAQAGAGTRDLQEIAESGVDLDRVNVVVYAGGSPHWHNDTASAEDHTLMYLTADGFSQAATTAASSMGGPECLTNFLNYGVANFPADEYALILWDHGDGPVIGYGKDMLFDNDSLTLQEMSQALENSPFGEDQKLSWVGFDACLMSSAELTCVWAPYANYLVASQETEPSFGWDYAFLSRLGLEDTPTLLHTLTDSYLSTCLEYYESRGYENRDTTLACMDLSYAPQLNEAINALFSKAAPEVAANYNTLTGKRVQTRALGRASTGSEYDLIDLYDMAAQLQDVYPEETAAIQTIVDNMVIVNATNAENCCGLSLYYPFYNKYYFEESWGDVYAQLGIFPEYSTYLQNYQAIWLQNDMLETIASSAMPSMASAQQYTLQLTDAQADAFASARYYILKQEGAELYTRIFSSQNTTLSGTVLTANFDGNVLYGRNNYGEFFIPVVQEHDTVGNISRYSIALTLTNETAFDILHPPEGHESKMMGCRFHLAVDNAAKEISVSALTPIQTAVDSTTLAGGKLEDVVLDEWSTYFFPNARYRFLTRNEDGTIQSLADWPVNDVYSAYQLTVDDGLEFLYAPLVTGKYFIMFEIEDTQGNRYCSELLPVEAEGALPTVAKPEPIRVDFTSGSSVLLGETQGVCLYLKIIEDYSGFKYAMEAVNNNDFPVRISVNEMGLNGDVFCPDGWGASLLVMAGETSEPDSLEFGDAQLFLSDPILDSLQFTVNIKNAMTQKTLLWEQPFTVTLSDETQASAQGMLISDLALNFREPCCGFLAREQMLYSSEHMRISLLGLGGSGSNRTLRGALCFENLSDQPQRIQLEGLCLDSIFLPLHSSTEAIPAGHKIYVDFFVDEDDLDLYMVDSIRNAKLLLQFPELDSFAMLSGFPESLWLDITSSQSGAAANFREGSKLLYNENGIRIALLRSEERYGSYYWYYTVVNNSDADIYVDTYNILIDGEEFDQENSFAVPFLMSGEQVCANQKTIFSLSVHSLEQKLSFRFRIKDFNQEIILYEGEKDIVVVP